jgi:hypothetical protein
MKDDTMLKRLAVLIASLLVAASAFAYEEAVLSPAEPTIYVGGWSDIGVQVHHVSGLNYMMWGFTFTTDRPDVIDLAGTLHYEYPNWSGTILVRGRAPGVATIFSGTKEYAHVTVRCLGEEPVRALTPVVTVKKGEPVRLSVSSTAAGRALLWYSGRIGDISHPLAGSGVDLDVTPTVGGTQYVWVLAYTVCSSSSTEFRLDVTVPRRRASR